MSDKSIEVLKNIKKHAFFSAKRKMLENYRTILLCRLMKEISLVEELKIGEQKKKAYKMLEYKNLLNSIKLLHKEEQKVLWDINVFIGSSEVTTSNSAFERSND